MSDLINFEKDSRKRSRAEIEQVLLQAGATNVGKKSIKCPFHDDHNPSATIKQADSGFFYFYCFVCDIADDVWALKSRITGEDVGDLLKDANPLNTEPRPRQKVTPAQFKATVTFNSFQELIDTFAAKNPTTVIEEKNAYTDPATHEADFYTLRLRQPNGKGKTFRQVSKTENGWDWTGIKGKAPLFNRIRIAECDRVLIVEGEKCVRAFHKLGMDGIAATTSPGGAMAAEKADWSVLNGKTCYVWRDNDDPGLKYEQTIIEILTQMDCKVYRIRVDELGLDSGGDIADYLDEPSMTNVEKVALLNNILQDAEGINTITALDEKFAKIFAGTFVSVPFHQKPILSESAHAVMPGTLTVLVGDPGSGKSFMMLEDFWRWHQAGIGIRLLMLEENYAFHQNRALAQMSGYADLLDVNFVADNATFAKCVMEEKRAEIESFTTVLTCPGSKVMTLAEIAAWVIQHAENGVRIIGVDPITAAEQNQKPWLEDQKFLFAVKPVLERTGATLVLSSHPRMGTAGKAGLSGAAGGAAYPRFSQCFLWLRRLDKPETNNVWSGNNYPEPVEHQQVLEIRKARNGRGQGSHIAMRFNHNNLCFDELGAIAYDPGIG